MALACSTTVASDRPLDEALGRIAALGVRHVDLLAMDGWAHVSPRELARDWDRASNRVAAALRKHGLELAALNTAPSVPVDRRDVEANARRAAETMGLIRLMKAHGVKVASLQPKCDDPDRPWRETLEAAAATFRDQVALAAAAGVVFGVELHEGSPFEGLVQSKALLDAVPGLAVTYDPSHPVMQGIPLADTAWLVARAAHVHVRDAARDRMCVPMGKGSVDFEWVLAELGKCGYRGHVAIEYLVSNEYDAVAETRKALDYLAPRWS
jgi:sugar phosphate isomerase/epimerase